MKSNTKLSLIAFMAITFAVSSCKKDKKELPKVDENELTTTIKVKFTNAANPDDVKTFTWRDIDGDSGKDPIIDTIKLAANKTYNMQITEILNETATPVQNITEEIEEESFDHLFVFKPAPTSILAVTIKDKDKNNFPIGLESIVTTGAAVNGTLQIILRHQLGVKNGTETPGSTDFDITFKVKIQ